MAASAEDAPDGQTDPAPPRPSDKRIQELVEDAWIYATYGRYSGSFRDGRLFEAVAETLRARTYSDRLVVELQNALNQTARDIPYETVAALKSGWSPGRTHWRTKTATLLLVIFSILLMLSVARLTLVHNRGADLVEELSDLVADGSGEQLQKLIEDHARDRLELESTSPANPGDFLADYVPASLLSRQRDEIKALSRSITGAVDEVGRYLATDSRFPLLGTQEAYCALGSVFAFDGVAYNAYCGTDAPIDLTSLPQASTAPAAPAITEDPPIAGDDPDALASKIDAGDQLPAADALPGASIAATPIAAIAGDVPPGCPDFLGYDDLAVGTGSTLDKWTTLFRREIDVMRCARTLTYDPSVQSFGLTSQLNELKRRVGYYALWILPALYGAMGAVMYHMRWVLDPLLPHPSLLRLAHRIVLGALAGIVLGWFYSPGTAISDAADRVGFSLFVVAFFFGFSLDIFFALLDRLVIRSERSIRGAAGADRDNAVLAALRSRAADEGAAPAAEEDPPRPPSQTAKEPVTFSRSAAHPA